MTLLALRGIMHAGFSFGIDDEDIPRPAAEQIDETTRTAREKVQQLIEAYNAGELEPLPGRTLDETLEMRIMQTLGKARDNAGKIAGQLPGPGQLRSGHGRVRRSRQHAEPDSDGRLCRPAVGAWRTHQARLRRQDSAALPAREIWARRRTVSWSPATRRA